jgi:hypothetical protein
VIPEVIAAPIVEAEVTAIVEEPAPAPKAKRAAKAKKTAAPRKAAVKKAKTAKA